MSSKNGYAMEGVEVVDPMESEADKECSCCECGCLEKLAGYINGGMSWFFQKLGLLIGNHPVKAILICLLFTAVWIPGIAFFFEQENDTEDLWVPKGSQAKEDSKIVGDLFPTSIRVETVYVVAANVLEPAVLQDMIQMDQSIKAITGTGDYVYDWESICSRLGSECWSNSILELWNFNETVINALTKEDILATINSVTTSPVYYNDFYIEQYLGKMTKNGSDYITGAEATLLNYVIQQNENLTIDEDNKALEWEEKYVDLCEEAAATYSSIDLVYQNALRSFSDAAGGAISGDIIVLFMGYIIIIVFVAIVLGRFSSVYHRVYVAIGGVLCVGLAIVVSFGFCSYCGFFYGPVHSILPFLMIGIGVDDMFVIIQALEQLTPAEKAMPVPERVSAALKHAGVSITVTSLTDILAFGVGASTILPALESFCVYACVGIVATFLFQATLFIAIIVVDEKRAAQGRDACCCCYVHKDYEPLKCSERNLTQMVFDKYYGPMIIMLPVKIVITVATLAMAAVFLYGVFQLDQYFDPIWFLPPDTYAYKFSTAGDLYFPGDGISTAIYLDDVDYYNDKWTMEDLYDDMVNDQYTYEGSVDSWHHSYWSWLNTSAISTTYAAQLDPASNYPIDETNFYTLLNTFLSGQGARFNKDIKMNATSGIIYASKITMKHNNLVGSAEEIRAMDSLRAVATATGYNALDCFAYSREYFNYETNEVIAEELIRNLGVAFACVLIMTFILLASPLTCLFVSLCVIFVLIDVAGAMYFWGLTIDTVTSVILILAIGLAVDYSAHIGETFMMENGTRNERVKKTMTSIGPAVFYGGFSTFLAFVLLATSSSYVFATFFKVFFCVVVFGMYHGLCFLPVLLSWIGPKPYLSAQKGGHSSHSDVAQPGEKAQSDNGTTHANGYAAESAGYQAPASAGNGSRQGGLDNAAVTLEDEDPAPRDNRTITPIQN